VFDVRILADDLTGALDSAVAFAGDVGLPVTWHLDALPDRRASIDLGTRDGSAATAVQRYRDLAPWLAAGELSFQKIDSLVRGHPTAEITACICGGGYQRVVIAPAFPYHGRITRDGQQWRMGEVPVAVGPKLAESLARDFPTAIARPGETADSRIVVYDAESDTDLDRIVAAELAMPATRLWVGSGGLSAALARFHQVPGRSVGTTMQRLKPPFLCLVGTDHPVTAVQTQQFAGRFPDGHVVIDDDLPGALTHITERMRRSLPSLVSVAATGSRAAAARRIDEALAACLEELPLPGTLLVTGGETLRATCRHLRADLLDVTHEIEPGLPLSRMRGGRFDGVPVISKSGAFGAADLLQRLGVEIGL
jgi:uncharacterized protein YgbK (DUF1537 family)